MLPDVRLSDSGILLLIDYGCRCPYKPASLSADKNQEMLSRAAAADEEEEEEKKNTRFVTVTRPPLKQFCIFINLSPFARRRGQFGIK